MKKTILLIAGGLVSAAIAFGQSNAALPAPWGDMLDMGTSQKTLFTVQAEYSPTKYDMGAWSGITQRRPLNTGALGLIIDSPLSEKIPIYADYGLKVKYTGNKFPAGPDNRSDNYHYVTLSIPASVLFKTGIRNTPLAFAGFLGLDGNFHLLARREFITPDGKEISDYLDKSQGYNFFTLDWHIGCRIYLQKYFFGIGYEGPITNFRQTNMTTEKFTGLTLTLGLTL